MLLDTDRPFQDVCTDSEFQTVLRDLQSVLRPRDQSQIWARNLRFICQAPGYEASYYSSEHEDTVKQDQPDEECVCCSDWAFEANESKNMLMVTSQQDFPDCNHYVAVSWCWTVEGEPRAAPCAAEEYFILDTTQGLTRPCTVPRDVLSRAIAYASFYIVPFLWFDKECINQQDPVDQEMGIQSMDIVYQRSLYPLGLLQTYLDQQWHLDMFNLMIEGLAITADQMPQVLELLTKLERDKWFTRAWILQESVCGGSDISLLIQHDPSLSKTVVLGRLPGEVDISLEELRNMLYWVYACITMSDSAIASDIEASILTTIDKILGFIPLVGLPPEKGFDDPDYRQTCNAAQALAYLSPRQNTVVADRIAIMGNLCDYRMCLDTNELETRGYGFSICAYALAILNGDLSLTQSDNPRDSPGLGFSWGPQTTLRMDHLEYFEDHTGDVVRTLPAKFVDKGLLVRGWLWKNDDSATLNLNITSDATQPDPATMIWTLLKRLVQSGRHELADVIWNFTQAFSFDKSPKSSYRGDVAQIPERLEEIMQKNTAEFIYRHEPWIKTEHDFRVLFEDVARRRDERTIDHQQRSKRWQRLEWFWRYLLEHADLPIASLCNDKDPQDPNKRSPAVFLPQLIQGQVDSTHRSVKVPTNLYVFLPSTCLDGKFFHDQRKYRPIFWEVQVETGPECEISIVRGTGKMFHGFCRPPAHCEPELFVFA